MIHREVWYTSAGTHEAAGTAPSMCLPKTVRLPAAAQPSQVTVSGNDRVMQSSVRPSRRPSGALSIAITVTDSIMMLAAAEVLSADTSSVRKC